MADRSRRSTNKPQPRRPARRRLQAVPDFDATVDRPDGYHPTDGGNADRLLALHGKELRYVAHWGKWLAWDGSRWAPLWISLAAIVGVSRAYVKIHHPSDVVGGAVTGLARAALLRRAILHFAPR